MPLLGKKLSLKDALCCLVAYFGVVIISTRGQLSSLNFGDPMGVTLALASTLTWAIYWIMNARQKGDPLVGLLICFLFGLPWVVTAAVIASDFQLASAQAMLGAVYIGLVEMGFAYILWLTALKLAENTAAVGNISYLSPFISLFLLPIFCRKISIQPRMLARH